MTDSAPFHCQECGCPRYGRCSDPTAPTCPCPACATPAAPIPLTLSVTAVQHTDDGGDGNPWTQWALIGEADGASGVIVSSWAKDGVPTADVLGAVFQSLRASGGLFGVI